MLVDFKGAGKMQEQSKKLDKIARETIQYFCEKIEKLGNGINNQILYDMCLRIEKQLSSLTLKTE